MSNKRIEFDEWETGFKRGNTFLSFGNAAHYFALYPNQAVENLYSEVWELKTDEDYVNWINEVEHLPKEDDAYILLRLVRLNNDEQAQRAFAKIIVEADEALIELLKHII